MRVEVKTNYVHVETERILNKLSEIKFSVGCDVRHFLNIDEIRKIKLELLCCTVNTKIYLTVTGLWNRGPLKALNSTKLVINEDVCPS